MDPLSPSPSPPSKPTSLEDALTDTFLRGEKVFRERWSTVEDKIRDSPTKAVLIAAGIGFALHRLPIGSLIGSHLKLLWALTPPAIAAAAAGKGFSALHEKMHQQNGRSAREVSFSGV